MLKINYLHDLKKFQVMEYAEQPENDIVHGLFDTHEEAEDKMMRVYYGNDNEGGN